MNKKNSALIICILFFNQIAFSNNEQTITRWEKDSITFDQPQFVVIDNSVTIGKQTNIGCGVHILGQTNIGTSCSIGHFSIIKNCTLGNNVTIYSHCVLENAVIEDNAKIGPFAHIEEGTTIMQYAEIGNFVEVKRSTIGQGTKAKHLSYLGDTTTGQKVNIGAGTITCNYNGVSKHKTNIGDNTLIGSNNCLVAPIEIGKGSITGAGSTLTQNVPEDTLAIARSSEQINKEGYASKLLNKYLIEKECSDS
jgi:bifunctional UDP-N-acetylglucosamine pyrophosphorylase/glucosamine-1-phosphate N-acetyltransferase